MYQTIRSLLRLMLLRLMLLRLKTILVPLALIGLFFITTQGALAQSTGTHRVSAGETLATIALRYQTDLPTLLRLNTVANPSLIRVGQILIVPTAIAGSGGGRESNRQAVLFADQPVQQWRDVVRTTTLALYP